MTSVTIRRVLRCGGGVAILLLGSATAGAQRRAGRDVLPVLDFPQAGIDDSAVYHGYQTRFYRDSRDNTAQVYLDARSGRVVLIWADALNESAGFTVRSSGQPASLRWGARPATVSGAGRARSITYRLTSDATHLTFGWFVLGSMRVERDFQYAQWQLRPFGTAAYREPVLSTLIADLARLPVAERSRHLALLHARDTAELSARLAPTMTAIRSGALAGVRISQPSFDARHRMTLELLVDPRAASARITGDTVALTSRTAAPVSFTVRVTTDGEPLTPLARAEIFDRAFLAFADSLRRTDPRVERQLRAVELLSSREKLMAGMPTYATYFGRDQMMSALMMQPIWTPAMMEHVIGSVLRKLAPDGEVSHEEALGGQAIREGAAEYAATLERYRALTTRGDRAEAGAALVRARAVLAALDSVRENYHMIDDEFQLPVLVARYLDDPRLDADAKRRFLNGRERGATRLALLIRELEVVAARAAPYAAQQDATNLVSFAPRDATHWSSGSWRDSGAGYANGRFAMDINAIWVPTALHGIAGIMRSLRALGNSRDAAIRGVNPGPTIARYLSDSASLASAERAWSGAVRHFVVRLGPVDIRTRVDAKLASLSAEEKRYWQGVVAASAADRDSIEFLALALDASGAPIPVENTDPATALFLLDLSGRSASPVMPGPFRALDAFQRAYPVGLIVDGLGPVVANDAFAPADVWSAFERDQYHSPRVVWGREVNLLQLGIARQLAAVIDERGQLRDPTLAAFASDLGAALRRIQSAVDASGLRHSELWSYRIEGDRLLPMRYGTSGDIQLWSTTSLAVQWALARLPRSAAAGR